MNVKPKRNGRDMRAAPSGRGTAVPAYAPTKYWQHYPMLPIPFGLSGATGDPSSELSTTASRFMQGNTMNHDDIEYFLRIDSDAPYNMNKQCTKVNTTFGIERAIDFNEPYVALGDSEDEEFDEEFDEE